jgi:hypothetical protein
VSRVSIGTSPIFWPPKSKPKISSAIWKGLEQPPLLRRSLQSWPANRSCEAAKAGARGGNRTPLLAEHESLYKAVLSSDLGEIKAVLKGNPADVGSGTRTEGTPK